MNVKIYKIICKDINIKDCYIGSTCQKYISQRKGRHKWEYKKNNNIKLYKFMRENGGFNNFEFIIIHRCICKDKAEKYRIEKQFYDKLKPTLNNYNPCPTIIIHKKSGVKIM
jgi:hypothetical protein